MSRSGSGSGFDTSRRGSQTRGVLQSGPLGSVRWAGATGRRAGAQALAERAAKGIIRTTSCDAANAMLLLGSSPSGGENEMSMKVKAKCNAAGAGAASEPEPVAPETVPESEHDQYEIQQ